MYPCILIIGKRVEAVFIFFSLFLVCLVYAVNTFLTALKVLGLLKRHVYDFI